MCVLQSVCLSVVHILDNLCIKVLEFALQSDHAVLLHVSVKM